MGGAFVAVADDSSATWWNPAGLAPGPFLDLAFGRASADIEDGPRARRERGAWVALSTPPLGFSVYRVKVSNIGPFDPIEPDGAGREDRRVAVPARSLSASQYGATLVQTLVPGVHLGATLKYVRVSGFAEDLVGVEGRRLSEWLDEADRRDSDARSAFDLDAGVLAVRGPVRMGGVIRNVRQPEVGPVRLPRQARVGLAFDASAIGARPVTLAVDADVRAYVMSSGARRVVAGGVEGWVAGGRVGVRAGARVNTTGARERAFTAGASVAIRSGLFADGYVSHGGEGGWGIAARASF
jgi:hypothetical protein